MSVERTHAGPQTRYKLRDQDRLACALTYTADPGEPAIWKILLPGPGGTEDLYGTQRFPAPSAAQLESWLSSIVGPWRAAELAQAVDAPPPEPAHLRDPRPSALS